MIIVDKGRNKRSCLLISWYINSSYYTFNLQIPQLGETEMTQKSIISINHILFGTCDDSAILVKYIIHQPKI